LSLKQKVDMSHMLWFHFFFGRWLKVRKIGGVK
jgi:hypothetical protein